MPFPGAASIVKRFGITLVCVLAARGCANEIEQYVHKKNTSTLESRVTSDAIIQELVPYGAIAFDAHDIEKALVEAQYAP